MPLETGAHQRAPQSRGFSWLRGFSRLSFAMYMANYYYIRTEFFADRALKDNSFDSWVSNAPGDKKQFLRRKPLAATSASQRERKIDSRPRRAR